MHSKAKYVLALAAVISVALLAGWLAGRDRAVLAYNQHNLIRLHVIANSDSVQDQVLKYRVRDTVLQTMAAKFEGMESRAAARDILKDNLDDIGQAAESTIKSSGFDYPVQVAWGDYRFPEKTYELARGGNGASSLTLPAGNYEAIRVVIGDGRGANWWCVLFPPLCFVGGWGDDPQENNVEEQDAIEAGKVTSPGDMDSAGQVRVKFKILELYESAKNWFLNINQDQEQMAV